MKGFASGGSMKGSASGGSIRSSDIPVAGGGRGEALGDKNVPAPYCFASAEAWGASLWRSVGGSPRAAAYGAATFLSLWGDVPNGDKNVPAPYCFASAGA